MVSDVYAARRATQAEEATLRGRRRRLNGVRQMGDSLSDRYLVVCANCQDSLSVIGTPTEARRHAEQQTWVFLKTPIECALCPPCRRLYNEIVQSLPPGYYKESRDAYNATEREESRDTQHGE